MADSFRVLVGNDAKDYDDPRQAGAAFFAADASMRPTVIHSMDSDYSPGGSGRWMASTDSIGHVGAETEYVKRLPNTLEVDKDFRAGYYEALEKSVNERLKNADWEAAKSKTPEQTPALDKRLYGDLEALARVDFEKAATAWETHAPKDAPSPAFVDREWRRQNEAAKELAGVIEASERGPAYGVMTIDDKPATSIRFERMENGGEQTFNVSYHLGNKTVAKLKGIDALTLADTVGEKNAKAILESKDGKGALKGEDLVNEYGISPEEGTRRAALKESRKAAEHIQLQEMEPLGGSLAVGEEEKNIVEPVLDKELEVIDGKEVVERAKQNRQRERELLAQEQERLGLKAEGKRIDVENLSEKAHEQDDSNDVAARTGGVPDREGQALTEREKNRQAELLELVHGQFRVNGAKFHFKDQPEKVAFKDNGERMVTATNDDRVAKAMATMAEAKGWKTIKVSGHPEFQREVWMEARLRGLEVRGYKPTEQDLKELDTKRDHSMRNSIERGEQERTKQPAAKEVDGSRKTNSARQNGDKTAEKEGGKAPAPAAAEKAATAALRAYAGRVLEHGAANYNHDPEEKPNYFVKLATDKGEKTVWGVDLKRAMSEGKVQTGDDVKLEYKGNQPVTVEALKRDKAGKVIGKEEITTNRNTWEAQKSDKHKVVEAVASALVDAKVKNPEQRQAIKAAIDARLVEREKAGRMPAVPVYDKAAASKTHTPERTGPVVERNSERTR